MRDWRWSLGSLMVAAVAGAGAVSDPPPLSWNELHLTAHKLTARPSISVRASVVAAADTAALLLPTAAATVVRPTGSDVILLESTATFASRTFDERLWVDRGSGAALQITDTETGAKNLRRVYRLLNDGFLVEQREPANPSEAGLPAERWTVVERVASTYPSVVPAGTIVTGALDLLCSPRLAQLGHAGDSTSFVVLVQRQLERVTVTVVKEVGVAVDFIESRAGMTSQVKGEVDALLLEITSQPMEPTASPRFRLFGLEHGLHVLWEPRRRVPLELSGQLRLLGEVTITLERVEGH